MRVDAERLRRAQTDLATLASSVDSTVGRLAAVLDAETGCWGADDIGATFAASYVPAVDTIRPALVDLRTLVRDVGDAVLVVAANAEAAEDRTRLRFG